MMSTEKTVLTGNCKAFRGRSRNRTGLAVVELAICLPMIVLILLGSIEVCNSIYLKQTATTAAYQAAKIASGSGGTQVAAETRVSEMLVARGIESGTLTFSPASQDAWTRGTPITVSVSIPASNNLGGVSMFYEGKSLQATVIMVRQ